MKVIVKNYDTCLIDSAEIITKTIIILTVIALCLYVYKKFKQVQKFKNMSNTELFYEYDKERNLNNNNEIVRMMKLLGYYYVDINKSKKKYIDVMITLIINNKNINQNCYVHSIIDYLLDDTDIILIKDIDNYTIGELKKIIMKTQKYLTYEKMLNNKFKRSVILSKHLNDKTTQHFYESINEEEIIKLNKLKILFRDKYPSCIADL